MKKFKTVKYTISSHKLQKHSFTIAMISDLHNVELGKKNENLIQALQKAKPDIICIAGDLLVGKPGATMKPAYEFLEQAVELAPVYYGLGNHEQRMKEHTKIYGTEYLVYEKRAGRLGVKMLENTSSTLEIKGEQIKITGLALPEGYYKRGKKIELPQESLKQLIGQPSKEEFQILLAHTPKYGDAYLNWGADLTLSGHYHGGMVRLPWLGGVISPDFRIFPKYCQGHFHQEKKHLIVSAGLGEHTIPIRIFDSRELVLITCEPAGLFS